MELSADIILVNLRVLSKLRQGDRLQCADSRYFGIDRGGSWIWQAISRWMTRDNRHNMLDRVEGVFKAVEQLELKDKEQHLNAARGGIRELICTYADDPTTVSRLENLISEPISTPAQHKQGCKGEEVAF